MAEENKPDCLPDGWVLKTVRQRGGSQRQCYINSETRQTFYTKEDLLRYVYYRTNIHPLLHDDDLGYAKFVAQQVEGSDGESTSVSGTLAEFIDEHPEGPKVLEEAKEREKMKNKGKRKRGKK